MERQDQLVLLELQEVEVSQDHRVHVDHLETLVLREQ